MVNYIIHYTLYNITQWPHCIGLFIVSSTDSGLEDTLLMGKTGGKNFVEIAFETNHESVTTNHKNYTIIDDA